MSVRISAARSKCVCETCAAQIMGRERVCPLCKAPMYARQVAPNHTLASIVRAFREVGGVPAD